MGVSGGRDSVCLLDLLVRSGLKDLIVVHVNHQLRGAESEHDAAFVRALATQHGLRFYEESVDVAALMCECQIGLELAAREARHQVFVRAVKKFGAQGVLLGHHADDQAETVLYNLLRGSHGLKGMRLKNAVEVGGVELCIVRPLLEVRRSEIDAYMVEHDLRFCEDASNAEGITARNRLRHEVMPLLAEILQREVVPNVNAAAEASMELDAYAAEQIKLAEYLDPQGRLFLPKFREQHLVVQQAILFQFLKKEGVRELSRALVSEALSLCDVQAPAKMNLPSGLWLRRKEQRLFVQRA